MAAKRFFFMRGNSKFVPLKELIPSYSARAESQIALLDSSLDAFRFQMDTSLDVILMKSLNNLKYVLLDYTKLVEQILVSREILPIDQNRRRNLTDLIDMAASSLQFRGGGQAIGAMRFLAEMQNHYLSNVEDKVYINWIKVVRAECLTLKSFIEDN